jgi:hypothetical protein
MRTKACQSLKASGSHDGTGHSIAQDDRGICRAFSANAPYPKSPGGSVPAPGTARPSPCDRSPPTDARWAGCRKPARLHRPRREAFSQPPSGRSGRTLAQRIDFLVGGKPPGLLFREKQPAVDGDLEYPSHPRHQFDFGAVKLNQPRPRTEGPRFIVSRLAPLDSYLHRCLSQGLPAIPLTKLTRTRGPCQSVPGYSAVIGVAFGGGRREGLRQSQEAGGARGKRFHNNCKPRSL